MYGGGFSCESDDVDALLGTREREPPNVGNDDAFERSAAAARAPASRAERFNR